MTFILDLKGNSDLKKWFMVEFIGEKVILKSLCWGKVFTNVYHNKINWKPRLQF